MFCGRLRLVLQTNPYSYSTKLNFTRPRLRKLRFRNKLTKKLVFASALGGSALAIGYIGMYSGISPYMSIVQDPPPLHVIFTSSGLLKHLKYLFKTYLKFKH